MVIPMVLFNILLELIFWGTIAGFILLMIPIRKELNRKELYLLIGILIMGLALRLGYGLFAPWHEHDHFIQIILNIQNNHLEGNFFSISNSYFASNGFYEFFYHKMLFFATGFSVYNIYLVSVLVSLLTGLLTFNFVRIFFKNKEIAFLSLAISILLPILIKTSATEIMYIISSFTLMLFVSLLYLFVKKPTRINAFFVSAVFLANLLGRVDFGLIFIFISLMILVYLLTEKRHRRTIFKSRVFQVVIILSIISSIIFVLSIVPSYGKFTLLRGPGPLLNTFSPISFFDNTTPTAIPFMKLFMTPLYFFIFFLISYAYSFKDRKYLLLVVINLILIVTMSLFDILSNPRIVEGTRKFLPLIPFMITQVSYGMHHFFRGFRMSFKIRKDVIWALIILILMLSFLQNIVFLETASARRVEQDFLVRNLERIPENSLILTVAKKDYEESVFVQYRNYQMEQRGLEFPSYLIPAGKGIDVMDIYREYDPELVSEYENVFYYRSIYSYHEEQAPQITEDFERDHEIVLIEETDVKNHDFDCETMEDFINGNSLTIDTDKDVLNIGFYRLLAA